jgi:tRNA U55 pseudouridine synthase TruB
MQKLTVEKYITNVLNRLSTISDQQKTTFRVPDIHSQWINFTHETGISNKDKLLILPVKLRVSSGFYIRMIPYYLKELFNINSHIYDIHRTRL